MARKFSGFGIKPPNAVRCKTFTFEYEAFENLAREKTGASEAV
jgi:hypothetical protein